ncbi:MAG: 2-oxoacid:acceptor oxidoreductase subunit alpha [Dehalococcoidia bacterium]|nr:2-oxoacid:acceptor oxidoreductase subunit alpha [Dehalococcoidia bacterium]
MADSRGVYPAGTHIMMGNVALSEGAIAAGCRFFGGYPITPANEVSEYLSRRMIEAGGVFIQMEDEIASIGVIIGAAWGGVKAMTATSGPGFSLMQEHIGHASAIEVPLVVADIQRTGPGGGHVYEMSGDVMQAKWGAHGDYENIALAPYSCQEMYDLTIDAFNLAGTWRVPVIILSDALLAHMYERVDVPTTEVLQERVQEWPRPSGDPKDYTAFTYPKQDTGELVVPPTPILGTPYHPRWAMSSPHLEKGGISSDLGVALEMMKRINNKIRDNRQKLVRYETRYMEDARMAVICYGTAARPCLRAIKEAREAGIKVGYLRLITIWPFADDVVREVGSATGKLLVPEMNLGQVSREVERAVAGKATVTSLPQARLHDTEEVLRAIKEMAA